MKPILAVVVAAAVLFAVALARQPGKAAGGVVPPAALHPPQVPPDVPAAVSAPVPATGRLNVWVVADGLPLGGAEVRLLHDGTRRSMSFVSPHRGAQPVEGLPPGRYRVSASRPGFLRASSLVPVAAGETAPVKIELRRGGRVEGTVTDVAGRPVEGATVAALRPGLGEPLGDGRVVRSGADGRFALDGLSSGTFDLRARHERYRAGMAKGLFCVGSGEILRADVVLDSGASLAGRILDDAGRPLAGATVVASNEETASAAADAAGRFRLDGLGPGPVSVLASAPGYGAAHRPGVRPGTDGLELRLSRAARLSGRVAGDPVPDCFVLTVWRFDPESARFLPLLTGHGEDGAFEAAHLSAGTYRLTVQADGFETLDEPEIRLGPGEVLADVQIRVRKR